VKEPYCPICNSDHIVRRDKTKVRKVHHAQRPMLFQRQLHEFAASCLNPNGSSRQLCRGLRPNRKRPYLVFGPERLREAGRRLGFLVFSPRLGVLVKCVLEHSEFVTPKRWGSSSTSTKFRIYNRKHGGLWVESNSDQAANIRTKSGGLNNTRG
jgi:hypothetical protein